MYKRQVPYHTEIMESCDGIDLDSARKVAGNGFYYLMGDIARLHSAVIAYARDFMIDRGFTYCVPPFMIRSNVVTGVMLSLIHIFRRTWRSNRERLPISLWKMERSRECRHFPVQHITVRRLSSVAELT